MSHVSMQRASDVVCEGLCIVLSVTATTPPTTRHGTHSPTSHTASHVSRTFRSRSTPASAPASTRVSCVDRSLPETGRGDPLLLHHAHTPHTRGHAALHTSPETTQTRRTHHPALRCTPLYEFAAPSAAARPSGGLSHRTASTALTARGACSHCAQRRHACPKPTRPF